MATDTPESPKAHSQLCVIRSNIPEVLTWKYQVQSRTARPQSGLEKAEGVGAE